MQKYRKYVIVSCIMVLLACFGIICIQVFTRQVLVKKLYMQNSVTEFILGRELGNSADEKKKVYINWAEKYPFQEVDKTDLDIQANRFDSAISFIDTYKRKFHNSIQVKFQDITNNNFFKYYELVECGRYVENCAGWDIVSPHEKIVEIEDGYYVDLDDTEYDFREHIHSIKDFQNFVKSNGSQFLYIQVPVNINKYGDGELNGIKDIKNRNIDNFLQELGDEGVPYMDLRSELHKVIPNEDYHNLFFRTDSHWTQEAGFTVANIVARKINNEYGIQVDFDKLNEKQYDKDMYPGWFLGHYGQKVTLARTNAEDISFFYPKFDTKFKISIPSVQIDKIGDFKDFYNRDKLIYKDPYRNNPYVAYLYGLPPYIEIENMMLQNFADKKILILRDSMGMVVLPFLAASMRHLLAIDLRSFNGSVEKLIQDYKPDVVIVMYTFTAREKINWQAHNSLYDFR